MLSSPLLEFTVSFVNLLRFPGPSKWLSLVQRQIEVEAALSPTREKADRGSAHRVQCLALTLPYPAMAASVSVKKLMKGPSVSHPVAGSYFWDLAASKTQRGDLPGDSSPKKTFLLSVLAYVEGWFQVSGLL